MEKYLHDRLQTFNAASQNQYKVQWGTSLDFIDDNYTTVNGQVMTPAQVFDLQIQVKEKERQAALAALLA